MDPTCSPRQPISVFAMHYMTVTECRVSHGRMQDFVAQVQQWEQDARASADAPEFHGVYLQETDPARALIVTQFATRAAAQAFRASGSADTLRSRILPMVDDPPQESEGFDLFYASLADGTRVVFGQDG